MLVTLDTVAYTHKPQSSEIAIITGRLKRLGPREVSPEEFARAVADGRTWCGGCFELDPSETFGGSRFVGQQLFALDFDNDIVVKGADGEPVRDAQGHKVKRSLMPDEDGYLDPWAAVDRWCKLFHADPLLIYESMSYSYSGDFADRWDPATKMKYRLVLDAGEPVTDPQEAEGLRAWLLEKFPEADRVCSNANRLYFGSGGRVRLSTEGVTRTYAHRD